MNPVDIAHFINSDIKPRAFKELTPAVYNDWTRALSKKEVNLDIARKAIQYIVDENIPFKVASFYKTVKQLGVTHVADQGPAVRLFGILPESRIEMYDDPTNPLKESLIQWFTVGSKKYIPNEQKIREMARYWHQRVKGKLFYAPELQMVDDDVFEF